MHILIVDDEPLNRFLLVHMLEQEGYSSIFEANSGEDALDIANKVDPDVVLLDIVMPGMSGYDVAPKLKLLAGDTYLPVIFITAHSDQHSVSKALECGGDDFLAKPFLREVLAAKLRAHARTRHLSKRAIEQNRVLSYHQNKTVQEHHIVKHIFNNALKIATDLPDNICYHMAPASNFNGDLIRVERGPANNLYLLLGDFTGHGLASAIGALPAARVFKETASKGWSVSQIVRALNQLLMDMLPEDMFFAACVMEVSSNGRQLTVWNGGMPDGLVVDLEGNIAHRFSSQHMALGILNDDEFESHVERYKASAKHQVLLYSDGVIESFDETGQMLTDEGFEEWLQQVPLSNLDAVVERLQTFRASSEQTDDLSLLKVQCTPANLFAVPATLPSTPWQLTFNFQAQQLKIYEPLQSIFDMLHGNTWLAHWMSDISTVLTELFANALEHGLLKLNSAIKMEDDGFYRYSLLREQRLALLEQGEINISLGYCPNKQKITIEVEDSGEGFDYSKVESLLVSNQLHGRGLALVVALTSEFNVSNNGRLVSTALFLD